MAKFFYIFFLIFSLSTSSINAKENHMILKLKGNVKKVFEKFNPEGGAYGLGRTHSHKH